MKTLVYSSLLVLLSSCNSQTEVSKPTEEIQMNAPTPEEMREALLDLVEREFDHYPNTGDLYRVVGKKKLIDNLRTAEVLIKDDGTVEIGYWTCDLDDLTFRIHVRWPGTIVGVHGRFQHERNWKAKIDGWEHGNLPVMAPSRPEYGGPLVRWGREVE